MCSVSLYSFLSPTFFLLLPLFSCHFCFLISSCLGHNLPDPLNPFNIWLSDTLRLLIFWHFVSFTYFILFMSSFEKPDCVTPPPPPPPPWSFTINHVCNICILVFQNLKPLRDKLNFRYHTGWKIKRWRWIKTGKKITLKNFIWSFSAFWQSFIFSLISHFTPLCFHVTLFFLH